MDATKYAMHLLNSKSIEEKLFYPQEGLTYDSDRSGEKVSTPSRCRKTQLTTKQIKFPKGHFHIPEKKAIALSSFANHELLAIEIMAQMLLYLPQKTKEEKLFKKGLFSTLKDEQKHLKLYIERLNEIGYEFGDFPLNDYFWRQSHSIKNAQDYIALMSITFEGANLDFASLYKDIFFEIEDYKTADILKIVLEEEISHVAFGINWMHKWRGDQSLWEYYLSNLPWPVTPARAKGKSINSKDRVKAKMDSAFINSLKNYRDNFSITERKEWKQTVKVQRAEK